MRIVRALLYRIFCYLLGICPMHWYPYEFVGYLDSRCCWCEEERAKQYQSQLISLKTVEPRTARPSSLPPS